MREYFLTQLFYFLKKIPVITLLVLLCGCVFISIVAFQSPSTIAFFQYPPQSDIVNFDDYGKTQENKDHPFLLRELSQNIPLMVIIWFLALSIFFLPRVDFPIYILVSVACGVSIVIGLISLLSPLEWRHRIIFLILTYLGIDYGIHYLNRYKEELHRGKSRKTALEIAFKHTGMASFMSLLITAASLLILLFSSSQTLQAFGLLSGAGIVFIFFSIYVIITSVFIIINKYVFKSALSPDPYIVSLPPINIPTLSKRRTYMVVFLFSVLVTVFLAISGYFVQFNASEPLINNELADKHISEITLNDETITYSDKGSLGAFEMTMNKMMINDGLGYLWISLLIIFMLLVFDFQNLYAAIISYLPLIVSLSWSSGLLSLFGIEINYVNMLFIPLVFGLGINNGVMLVHRYIESGKILETLNYTGRGIIISSITLMLGLIPLLVLNDSLLTNIFIFNTIGLSCLLISSFTFMPLILRLFGSFLIKQMRGETTS